MKDVQYYLQLEYPLRVDADPKGGFVASIPDLPGCYAAGNTKLEAVEKLEESKEVWLESHFQTHGSAPEPNSPSQYSGRVLVRMPRFLHRKLYEGAQSEEISLNQYIIALLADGSSRTDLTRAVRKCLEPISNQMFDGKRAAKRRDVHISGPHRQGKPRKWDHGNLSPVDSRTGEKNSRFPSSKGSSRGVNRKR